MRTANAMVVLGESLEANTRREDGCERELCCKCGEPIQIPARAIRGLQLLGLPHVGACPTHYLDELGSLRPLDA